MGDFKVGELVKTLHVSPNSYYPFMRQKGTHAGLENVMYKRLHRIFQERQEAGLYVPGLDEIEIESDDEEEDEEIDSDYDQAGFNLVSIAPKGDDNSESDKENRPDTTDKTTRYNCNEIRSKSTEFMIKAGLSYNDFIDRLGVRPRSFYSLMRQWGPNGGARLQAYEAVHRFFVEREAMGALRKKHTKAKGKAKTALTRSSGHKSSQPRISKTQPKRARKSNKKISTT
ncbi:hypothetical protein H2200_012430 [Cladophialophora chaetospira]|uniref:DUF7726 domain-containing protein n=1 Tax=Cladophialophora chaetospira TaxID=386627 RepID=A0AA38WXV4_9EURO|nr:hypothetical protein H2200_012430 [Cladophialophora chaetospira]